MDNRFENIESYFEGRYNEEEKRQFEERCGQDEEFAQDVAFYVQSRQVLKEELLSRKRAGWAAPGQERRPVRHRLYLIPAAAAAVILLFLFVYLLVRPAGPAALATTYIRTHYNRLSQTMDGARDSLQQGIAAYNNRQFPQALALFTAVAHTRPHHTDALLYLGLVYLRLQQYDQALAQFDTLSHLPGLYSNPGPFLKAVTLMERDAPGDRDRARQLLQEVVRRQLDGSAEAAAWLRKF